MYAGDCGWSTPSRVTTRECYVNWCDFPLECVKARYFANVAVCARFYTHYFTRVHHNSMSQQLGNEVERHGKENKSNAQIDVDLTLFKIMMQELACVAC